MRGRVRKVVIYFKFHENRSRGLGAVGVENRPLPLTRPMAYTTACITVQAVIVHRALATGPRSQGIMHQQPAINNKLAPKPNPDPTLTLTLTLTKLLVPKKRKTDLQITNCLNVDAILSCHLGAGAGTCTVACSPVPCHANQLLLLPVHDPSGSDAGCWCTIHYVK